MTANFPAPSLTVSPLRPTLLWVLGGAGLLVALAVLLIGLNAFSSTAFVGSAALYVTGGSLMVARVQAFHPHSRFGVGNVVTLARLVITSLFAGFTIQTCLASGVTDDLAWGFFAGVLLAMLLDGIDGYFARRQGLSSAFGARFDMETDALLILLLSIAAFTLNKAGAWVMLSGALRYLFVVAGWIWPRVASPLPPSHRRKLVCVIQIAALTLELAPVIVPPVSTAIAFAALVLLVYSFAVDVLWSLRHGAPENSLRGSSP